jgi:hypothetical protein
LLLRQLEILLRLLGTVVKQFLLLSGDGSCFPSHAPQRVEAENLVE